MHDVLRQRLLRKIESLPEEQVYHVLDYIEFLESKYARHLPQEATGLQKFAEGLEDRLRKKAVSPATIREAFQLIAAADRVLSSVSTAGSRLLGELGALGEEGPPAGGDARRSERARPVTRGTPRSGGAVGSGRDPEPPGEGPRERSGPVETPPHGDPLRPAEGPGKRGGGPSGQG